MLTGLFWLVVAASATRVSWRSPMRLVGLTLCFASAVTTALFFSVRFEVSVIAEVGLAVLITSVAAASWSHRGGHPYFVVMALAAFDTMFAGAICAHGSQTFSVRLAFAVVTNLIFGAQCACVAWPGLKDAVQDWLRAVDRRRILDRQRHESYQEIMRRDRERPR